MKKNKIRLLIFVCFIILLSCCSRNSEINSESETSDKLYPDFLEISEDSEEERNEVVREAELK